MNGLGFKLQVSRFGFCGFGFGIWALGVRVEGLRLRF